MAKAPAKTVTKTTKAPAKPKAAKASSAPEAAIEKICIDALAKLQSLGIEQQLQSDIEWCLGSYRHDKNPVGLYEMAGKIVSVYTAEKAKKTKGITAKMISDIEKALESR